MADQEAKRVSKIILTFDDTQANIGISAPECDPFFTPIVFIEGDEAAPPLEQVLDYLPMAIQAAQNRWQELARNPTYDRPAAAAPARRTGRQTPARPSGPQQQPLL